MSGMGRREFVALLGGATAWPLAARAQPTGKLPIIGFLGTNTASAQRQWTDAFLQRLRELGWIEGRTVAIEYRWADGRLERSAELVAELVRLKVDVIVTHSAEPVLAAKRATAVIPIIFPVLGDPVGTGVVASLTRPDGNATGSSLQATDVAAKRVEILRELLPGFRRLGIVANIGAPAAVLEIREVQTAASTIGLATTTFEIRQTNDIATAIDALKDRVEALYVVSDPLVATNRNRLGILAVGAQLPTMHGARENVEAGGLVSYGPNFPALFRRGAEYVDKVLRGAKPADLPVEQPTKFDLVISLITAKALGLTIPPLLLARADEVIE
jgi:putative tryptophan/tyrosine transport system substrate-binding protein